VISGAFFILEGLFVARIIFKWYSSLQLFIVEYKQREEDFEARKLLYCITATLVNIFWFVLGLLWISSISSACSQGLLFTKSHFNKNRCSYPHWNHSIASFLLLPDIQSSNNNTSHCAMVFSIPLLSIWTTLRYTPFNR
jgi:hypothetical protein